MPTTPATYDWEAAWSKIIEKGQKFKDKRTIREFLSLEDITTLWACSNGFLLQIKRDMQAKFKFYDALGMWIQQRVYWSEGDLECIMYLINKYLKEE